MRTDIGVVEERLQLVENVGILRVANVVLELLNYGTGAIHG